MKQPTDLDYRRHWNRALDRFLSVRTPVPGKDYRTSVKKTLTAVVVRTKLGGMKSEKVDLLVKLVWLALISRADEFLRQTPLALLVSVEGIACDACLTYEEVAKALKILETLGFLRKVRRYMSTNITYLFDFPRLEGDDLGEDVLGKGLPQPVIIDPQAAGYGRGERKPQESTSRG